MSRSVQTGDIVHITSNQTSDTYQISHIQGRDIYIHPLGQPTQLILIYPNAEGRYVVYGAESAPYQIQFMARS